ncbi:MAG: ABC-F family ATP-binding cassette domain-containing protein [Chlamydiia bacterium]|nr:ABC-F family ATP-binding cassette domain-containing protein [Chlamydiia bacterium]
MFSIENLTMVFGGQLLFRGASLSFAKKRKIGLVGANGAGKTTFMKILIGEETPTEGKVIIPKGVTMGMLNQDYFRFNDEPLLSLVLQGDKKLWKALRRKEALLSQKELSPEAIDEISQLETELSMRGAYQAEGRASHLLKGLGIENHCHSMPLNALSGGYKLRALLAQVLFGKPEVLLLDEPTNYLDIFSIEWLERHLKDYPGTVILSSHDRFFLNGVCQEILDIDYGEIRRYIGNFDAFHEQKKGNVQLKEAELASLSKRKKEVKRFIEQFKAKPSKARQAGSREKMIEKLEEKEKSYEIIPSSRIHPHFIFPTCSGSGQRVLCTRGLSKSYGTHQVLHEATCEIQRGERVAIVGANGMGKSTFLEILTEHLSPNSGSVLWGPHVEWAYFPQNYRRLLNDELTVYEWLFATQKGESEQKIRQSLGNMLFQDDAIRKKVGALSGGEGARLVFASLLLKPHNALLLDEPTNHLDMESVQALIEGLKNYSGTLILVSHNRYFISEIATRILELHPHGIHDFHGGYEEFVEVFERDYLSEKPKETHPKQRRGEKQKELKCLKRDIERLEKEIHQCEKEMEALNHRLSAPEFYDKTTPNELQMILNQKDQLEKKREETMNFWEEKMEALENESIK